MLEQRTLGHVIGDFLTREDFLGLCDWWLTTNKLHHVVTLNPEMVMQAEHDIPFRASVNKADLRIPDGAGLIWARWYLRSTNWPLIPSLLSFMFQPAPRITGVDIVTQLAKLCVAKKQPVYLLGGTRAQVDKTADKLQKQFPGLTIFTSPEHAFSLNGPEEIIADITKKQPAVLLVAYGSPKQTVWIDKNRHHLPNIRIAVGVGGAFAIISEERPRSPQWLRRLNLEWLWRLILEPSRLPRIWRAAVQFPLMIRRQKLHEQTEKGV